MKKVIVLLVLAALALFGQLTYTRITDTLLNADGTTNFDGIITISWPSYTFGGAEVSAGHMPVVVVNGALSVSLTPTDRMTCRQACSYTVTYMSQGKAVVLTWLVPTSSSPLLLTSVNNSASGGSSNTTNTTTTGNCTVTGSALGDLACPGSIGAGDASTTGAVDLKGATSHNTFTLMADPSTASYTAKVPAAAPTTDYQILRTDAFSVALSAWPLLWDTPLWPSQLQGDAPKIPTFDPAAVTAGDCTQWSSTKTLISLPCPSGSGGNLSGTGIVNTLPYWATTSSVGANANWLFDGTTLDLVGPGGYAKLFTSLVQPGDGPMYTAPMLEFSPNMAGTYGPMLGGIRWIGSDGVTEVASIRTTGSFNPFTVTMTGVNVVGTLYPTGGGGSGASASTAIASTPVCIANATSKATNTCNATGNNETLFKVYWSVVKGFGTCTAAASCTRTVTTTITWTDRNAQAHSVTLPAASLATDLAEVSGTNYGELLIDKSTTSQVYYSATVGGSGGTNLYYNVDLRVQPLNMR